MTPSLIAWDFDGVLNRNIRDGRFIWADRLEADLGISLSGFQTYMFGPERISRIVRGQMDLLEELEGYLTSVGSSHRAQEVMDYWFERDQHLDPEVMGWLRALPCRHVIATNNEPYRARFIAKTMGLGAEVEHVFVSGHLGAAKPDAAFFEAIEAWSELPSEDILLIDDLARNTDAAAARGWQVYHFTDETRAGLSARLGLSG